jgi:hypothetical protein
MAQKILVRRGTKAELDSISLDSSELGFTVDTREVYVGDGASNYLVGRAIVGLLSNRPAPGVSGRIYEAIDEGRTYLDNGSIWKLVGIASLDDVLDGSIYGKVLRTELSSGQVARVRAVSGGVNVTGDQLQTHITDDSKHRLIGDGSTSTTELWSSAKINNTKSDKVIGATAGNLATLDSTGNLVDSGLRKNDNGGSTQDIWSANKIQAQIDSKASGLFWTGPAVVLRMVSDADHGGSPPPSPIDGTSYVANNWGGGYVDDNIYERVNGSWLDIGPMVAGTRVIVDSEGTAGSFTGQERGIGDWNGSSWSFITPEEGWAILVTGDGSIYENNGYTYTDNMWTQFTGAGQINPGIGLVKDGNTIDIQLGAGIKEMPADEIGVDVVPNDGLRLTSTDSGGQLTVDYDNSSIGIVSDSLAVKPNGVVENHLNPSVAGNGLIGGGGTPIGVGVGDGISVTANAVAAKIDANKGLSVDSNGLKVVPDNYSIIFNGSGQIAADIIDGGSF